jgi:hypothetical protein
MYRVLSTCVIWISCILLVLPAAAQTREKQASDSASEVFQLKQKAAAQEERIAQLEKVLKALPDSCAGNHEMIDAILRVEQAVKDIKATPAPRPIPPVTPAWQSASAWNVVKKGMSRAEATNILGPPTRETTVMDTDTVYYREGELSGTLTFVGDRLTVMVPPAF